MSINPDAELEAALEARDKALEEKIVARMRAAIGSEHAVDLKRSTGAVDVKGGIVIAAWSKTLVVESRLLWVPSTERNTIRQVEINCRVAPVGAAVTATLFKNTNDNPITSAGGIILPDGKDRRFYVPSVLLTDVEVTENDRFALDITQIGSDIPGVGFAITLRWDVPVNLHRFDGQVGSGGPLDG